MYLCTSFFYKNQKLISQATKSKNTTAIRLSDIKEITKFRLTLSVVFSSVTSCLLGTLVIDFTTIILLVFGGYFIVGASNAFNQIIERDLDALMARTQNRPIPSGRMSVNTAMFIAILCTVLGLVMLYLLNPKTAMFGAISMFLYTCVYTPLKTKTPLSVLVGAFPGAIPFMLGWIAATDNFGIESKFLFMLQFFWQFPHFWSLAWSLDEDYKKAGFRMLPTGKKDKTAAFQIILYTICMIIISILPYFEITGRLKLSLLGVFFVFFLGLIMLFYTFKLYKKLDNTTAKQLQIVGILYISVIQIVFVIDKYAI